jgi:hypothetical protein
MSEIPTIRSPGATGRRNQGQSQWLSRLETEKQRLLKIAVEYDHTADRAEQWREIADTE